MDSSSRVHFASEWKKAICFDKKVYGGDNWTINTASVTCPICKRILQVSGKDYVPRAHALRDERLSAKRLDLAAILDQD